MELIEKMRMEVGILMIHWNLIDPHTKKNNNCRSKRFMAKNLETRMKTGEPYIVLLILVTNICMIFKRKKV